MVNMKLLFFALALRACDAQQACIGGACIDNDQDDGNVLLQKRTQVEKVDVDDQRAASADAQFLIQASFGPTRASMAELSSTDYIGWIKKQISLPVESHREYYRARINPQYDTTNTVTTMPVFSPKSPCTKGSRWRGNAVAKGDVGQKVEAAGGKISVAGSWRSDIEKSAPSATCTDIPDARMKRSRLTCARMKWASNMPSLCASAEWKRAKRCQKTCYEIGRRYPGDDCSGGWKNGLAGQVCRAEGGDSGYVGVFTGSTRRRACRDRTKVVYMPNPTIFLKDKSKASKTNDKFQTSAAFPGTLFHSGGTCTVDGKSLVDVNGKYFALDSRMALQENTVSSPQVSDKGACVKKNIFNAQGCKLQPKGAACAIACGSVGEIANDGTKGHQYSYVTFSDFTRRRAGVKRVAWNTKFDNRWRVRADYAKYSVWIMHSLQASDQLRQRTAWALAQIIVVGTPGNLANQNSANEGWTSLYDIFLRNAFGSFRDILQQVTYNPLMAKYLTYQDSRSYDASRSYPDENYAREIMQLFTVGVDLLHRNGSAVMKNGVEVPAYTNENIMNFARVFTGFRQQGMRSNIEQTQQFGSNLIDPIRIAADWHDKYPKPDITGGYLGDGYPLCADFPKFGYLLEGAKFEFLGYEIKGVETFELPASSGLHKVLCGHGAGQCVFSLSVTLKTSVKCVGAECEREAVDIVKAGDAYYEYVAPACVHHFISNGQLADTAATSRRRSATKMCVDPNTPVGAYSCSTGCTDTAHPSMTRRGHTCANSVTKWLDRRTKKPRLFKDFCKADWFAKRDYCRLTCWRGSQLPEYDNQLTKLFPTEPGMNCSAGAYTETRQCDSLLQRVSYSTAQAACKGSNLMLNAKPKGQCGYRSGMPLWTQQKCSVKVKVHPDGKVSAHTSYHHENRFEVFWKDDAIDPGDYDAVVVVQKLFSAVPAKDELIAKAKIGAAAPSISCTVCSGEVKAYSASKGLIDEHTVFEAAGRFFKNVESMVHVTGGKSTHMFRNPPVFLRPGLASVDNGVMGKRRAIQAEVESLIDNLFHHPNTPVNLARKMLQRFVTSNPTPAQIEAAANAFISGTYSGATFTGKYGDLGAMVAAILLHPDARKQDGAAEGLLREPMLKLMHFMRSMEYKDKFDEPIMFGAAGEKIGQFPYQSPSVFSYFQDDFMPRGFGKKMSSGPEPEPEPEPEPLVAPEFQIFTPPLVINLLNVFTSLVKWGVSGCSAGLGISSSDYVDPCVGGSFEFKSSGSEDSTIQDLNLLLTGGRLTKEGTELVKRAYIGTEWCHKAAPTSCGAALSGAQTAMLLGPEFNTLGAPLPKGTRPEPPPPAAEEAPKDYKAVVLVFLNGGADTYNMLVPRDCQLHDEYAKTRAGMNLKISELLPLPAKSQKCKDFGLNPAMPNLKKLYDSKEAAFLSNIGVLLEPTKRSLLKGGAVSNCPSLFSHSHSQRAAMSCKCPAPGDVRGVGGGMADALGKKKLNTASFSVSGTSAWMRAVESNQEIIDPRGGSIRFGDYEMWEDTIKGIAGRVHGNVYCEQYATAFQEAVMGNERLASFLNNVSSPSLDKYSADTALKQQLHQVARLIATRKERKVERDFFFVQLGGWDMHSGFMMNFPKALSQVDDAIADFVAEMKTQQIFDKVVLATESDFGRTLSYNGAGTDHGWGGNHFIVGGTINGGEVYNDFLETFQPGSEWDAGRGRVIPKYPWENMMVPIAEWLGVDAGDMPTIFPNLDKFNRSEHILSRDTLFLRPGTTRAPIPTPSPGGGSGKAPTPKPAGSGKIGK